LSTFDRLQQAGSKQEEAGKVPTHAGARCGWCFLVTVLLLKRVVANAVLAGLQTESHFMQRFF
jgi:hypothetical protein